MLNIESKRDGVLGSWLPASEIVEGDVMLKPTIWRDLESVPSTHKNSDGRNETKITRFVYRMTETKCMIRKDVGCTRRKWQ